MPSITRWGLSPPIVRSRPFPQDGHLWSQHAVLLQVSSTHLIRFISFLSFMLDGHSYDSQVAFLRLDAGAVDDAVDDDVASRSARSRANSRSRGMLAKCHFHETLVFFRIFVDLYHLPSLPFLYSPGHFFASYGGAWRLEAVNFFEVSFLHGLDRALLLPGGRLSRVTLFVRRLAVCRAGPDVLRGGDVLRCVLDFAHRALLPMYFRYHQFPSLPFLLVFSGIPPWREPAADTRGPLRPPVNFWCPPVREGVTCTTPRIVSPAYGRGNLNLYKRLHRGHGLTVDAMLAYCSWYLLVTKRSYNSGDANA